MEKNITATELDELIASGEDVILLDVRRKEDFDKAPETVGGAQWKDPGEIDRWLPIIPEHRNVIVYCARGGSVSQSVRQRLADSGHTARFVEGGLEAIKNSSFKCRDAPAREPDCSFFGEAVDAQLVDPETKSDSPLEEDSGLEEYPVENRPGER